jgi:hypothetical protein
MLIGSLHSWDGPDARASSTDRPTAQDSESISALPPKMGTILVWSVFSSVTRPLLSYDLVVRQHSQNTSRACGAACPGGATIGILAEVVFRNSTGGQKHHEHHLQGNTDGLEQATDETRAESLPEFLCSLN